MDREKDPSLDPELHNRAKEMMIAGEDWEKIMNDTHLRLKDLRRIQINEIDPKF
ncbi:hypothetical protein [Clostridium sp.]|uniref:hypothetical protein n=1 Tax=Clostridium sp. TaxID=1506 RepID=UPI002FC6B092